MRRSNPGATTCAAPAIQTIVLRPLDCFPPRELAVAMTDRELAHLFLRVAQASRPRAAKSTERPTSAGSTRPIAISIQIRQTSRRRRALSMMRWSVPISTRRNPPLQGNGAIERHHGPTVPAPPRYRPPQLSSLERGGKLSCPQSLENTQNRKIHETAPGAVDDALERADLNPADRPLEGVGAIERDQAPSVAGPSRYQPSQSSPPFERGGNFPGRKALKIHKTAKESRFDLHPLPPSISIAQWT